MQTRLCARAAGFVLAWWAVAFACASASAQGKAGTPATLPCDREAAAVAKAEPGGRAAAAEALIRRGCRPLPPVLMAAIQQGKWEDGAVLAAADRTALLAQATATRHAEAETLAVTVLESGAWPGGGPLSLESGADLIRGLGAALTPYRVHLLLDIYEQVPAPSVCVAVIETLRGSPLPEALLPALEANAHGEEATRAAGAATLKGQAGKDAAEVLAELIRQLPEGPLLNWAHRLAERYPTPAVSAALKERGLGK